MFIGAKYGLSARSNDAAKQLLDLSLGGSGVGSSVPFFKDRPLLLLRGPHRATSPKLRIVEAVDEMRGADQEIDVHGPILAVLEGSKAIQDEGLSGRVLGSHLLLEEQAVSAESVGDPSYGGVGDAGLSGNLA
jgi:hypothetical protein